MPWCCPCQERNEDQTHCKACGEERVYPLWQRAMEKPGDPPKKYAEPFSGPNKWQEKQRRNKKRDRGWEQW